MAAPCQQRPVTACRIWSLHAWPSTPIIFRQISCTQAPCLPTANEAWCWPARHSAGGQLHLIPRYSTIFPLVATMTLLFPIAPFHNKQLSSISSPQKTKLPIRCLLHESTPEGTLNRRSTRCRPPLGRSSSSSQSRRPRRSVDETAYRQPQEETPTRYRQPSTTITSASTAR